MMMILEALSFSPSTSFSNPYSFGTFCCSAFIFGKGLKDVAPSTSIMESIATIPNETRQCTSCKAVRLEESFRNCCSTRPLFKTCQKTNRPQRSSSEALRSSNAEENNNTGFRPNRLRIKTLIENQKVLRLRFDSQSNFTA